MRLSSRPIMLNCLTDSTSPQFVPSRLPQLLSPLDPIPDARRYIIANFQCRKQSWLSSKHNLERRVTRGNIDCAIHSKFCRRQGLQPSTLTLGGKVLITWKTVLLVRSLLPSASGWYAVVRCNEDPIVRMMSFQSREVHNLSWSPMIDAGAPNKAIHWAETRLAVFSALSF